MDTAMLIAAGFIMSAAARRWATSYWKIMGVNLVAVVLIIFALTLF